MNISIERPPTPRTLSTASTDTQDTAVEEPVPGMGSQLNALRAAGLEFGELPLEFLEAYPYPALVLVPGVPVNGETHVLEFSLANIPPLSPVWTNHSWKRFARGRKSILECLSLDNVRRLTLWLSGALDQPQQPQQDVQHNDTKDFKAMDSDLPSSASPSLAIDFTFGHTKVKLNLAKTTYPLYQIEGDKSTPISSHVLAVVTSIPSGRLEYPGANKLRGTTPLSSSNSSSVSSSGFSVSTPATDLTSRSSSAESSRKLSLDAAPHVPKCRPREGVVASDEWRQPLYLRRDGSIAQRVAPTGKTSSGLSYDVFKLLEYTNWEKTPLGPRTQWAPLLDFLVSWILNSPLPAALWCGKDLTFIYNQAYAEQLPNHPHVFGQSGTVAWAELWPSLGPLSELVLNGTPLVKEDDFSLTGDKGSGALRETYRSQTWVPLKISPGRTALLHSMVDTTAKVIAERRSEMLRQQSIRAASCRTLQEFDEATLETLHLHPKEAPFALLYRVQYGAKASLSERVPVTLRYAGGVGVPEEHSSAPATVRLWMTELSRLSDLVQDAFSKPRASRPHSRGSFYRSRSSSMAGSTRSSRPPSPPPEEVSDITAWPFAEAIRSCRPVHVADCSATIDGYPVRVWDELPQSAVVIPIEQNHESGTVGAVLVVGLNCRLPFDDLYRKFISDISITVGTQFAAVRSQELELKRKEGIAAVERAKNLLLSSVSHELLGPLSLIAEPLDDALEDLEEGETRSSVSIARRQVYRLSRLINILTEMNSFEAGGVKGSFTQVNLGEVTSEMAGMFRASAASSMVDFMIECDHTAHKVFIDRDRYERILFTLVGNALRFTQEGKVTVSLRYEENDAVLTVQDTGVGIPEQLLDILCDVNGETTGGGMQLSYTKKLVQLHQGTFYIDSVTAEDAVDGSHGSAFIITLPLGSDHLAPDTIVKKSATNAGLKQFHQSVFDEISHIHWGVVASSARLDPKPPLGVKMRNRVDPGTVFFTPDDVVLIVDGVSETRKYMRSMFEPFCKVEEALDGESALDLCRTRAPNLIIADALLPRMSGFELVTALRAGTDDLQMVPVILLTTSGDDRSQVAYGADDYLFKPFATRELIARAHMQLQLGKKRQALELAFAERTNELRFITDHTPVGIFRCNEEGWGLYANQTWHDMCGYPTGIPIVNWGDYVMKEHQERIRDIWTSFVATGADRAGGEFQCITGTWVQCIVLRLAGIEGAPPGILGCWIDITDRIRNEKLQQERVEEAEKRRKDAEEARERQEELIDITSHEIRNPISSLMQITLQTEMQRAMDHNGGVQPTQAHLDTLQDDLDALNSIYQCGQTQERISNDVLSLGKIQLGKMELFDVDTDLRREAHKLMSVFQGDRRMNKVDMTVSFADRFTTLNAERLRFDPVRFGQIVTNLLSNAIRFTSQSAVRQVKLSFDIGYTAPEGIRVVRPDVDVAVLDEDATMYLFGAVSDTGPGLTEAELDSVFQRFSQASSKTHTVFGGSGLGLFVCRKVARCMGGEIDVDSTYGKGSTFRFFIKVKRAPSVVPVAPAKKIQAAADKLAARVLIVEDNIINRKVLERQLRAAGVTVDSVTNGLEGLERIRETQGPITLGMQRYDCVLMDLEMPVMDGFNATRKVREDEAVGLLNPTLIIALTGNARHVQSDKMMVDFDDAIVKPYRLDDLLRRIAAGMDCGPKPHHPIAGSPVGKDADKLPDPGVPF